MPPHPDDHGPQPATAAQVAELAAKVDQLISILAPIAALVQQVAAIPKVARQLRGG